MDTFPLFNSFPPEIHSLILASCSENDRICLRLTCKYLYTLSPTTRLISLTNTDDPEPLCFKSRPKDQHYEPSAQHMSFARLGHRAECHRLCYEEMVKRRRARGWSAPPLRGCRTSRWTAHCECFSRSAVLHRRLRTWVPKGLRYCSTCETFTERKAWRKGRCNHGLPRWSINNYNCRRKGNFWTHRPRKGAFGQKLWKKWFNNNAMNSLEQRLSQPPTERNGNKRYALRTLQPKDIDTRRERKSHW
ncbi:hypothetical protein M430DRAFT_33397 [Amorphotheca resinae ATCC 22711]|uniref:F-box domain-containing protein n=1 Tax=Amorphotheca resinae ATCC 22711 TaxID=857342 RepID=A0A2T3BC09_AMORE|nr:hypothetical protein M430DRAFT_33397 [Amorphotheca resinae ATCC 22711]PSS25830.1 hypothetical protein M430DRAFT_33397 [Amorphotheca resinae ATCC 22711]